MTSNELGLPASVELHCLFCNATQFEVDDEKPIKSGDMVKCSSCGRLNDYDAMFEVCKEEVDKLASEGIQRLFKEAFKGRLR